MKPPNRDALPRITAIAGAVLVTLVMARLDVTMPPSPAGQVQARVAAVDWVVAEGAPPRSS